MLERRYWLFKSEPDVFSIVDLMAAPNQCTCWEGVRNYQARNYLRDNVKLGDMVFFYHSQQKPMAIVGIAEVVREAYPDSSAFDPQSPYYDAKSDAQNPTWVQVDIRFVRRFDPPISLDVLKVTPGLELMVLIQKGSRLSIQPVKEQEWKVVAELADS